MDEKKVVLVKIILIILFCWAIIGVVSATECDDVYYFIVSNNYEYSEQDLNNSNIEQWMVDRYELYCYNSSYPSLPENPNEFIESNEEKINCDVNSSVPLSKPVRLPFQIPLNIDEECKIGFHKTFFSINKDNYEIEGVRWFTLSLLLSLVLIIGVLTIDKLNKKFIKREDLNV